MDSQISNQPLPPNNTETVNQNLHKKPFLLQFFAWAILLEGVYSLIQLILAFIAPPSIKGFENPPVVNTLEAIFFIIISIIAFIGLLKTKRWGLYAYALSVIVNLLVIITNIDGTSRNMPSYILSVIEILILIYLFRFYSKGEVYINSIGQSQVSPSQGSVSTTSLDEHTILIIFLLVFFYPLGFILMWLQMKHWSRRLKLILSTPVALFVMGLILGVLSYRK